MKVRLRTYGGQALAGLLFASVLAGVGILIWKLMTTPSNGTSKTTAVPASLTVSELALVGVLATATVTAIGVLLKQSIDRRTLEISLAGQQRLQMETAMQTVKLMTLDSGQPAPAIQISAALLVLAKLGEVSLAVDLAAEMWPTGQVTSSAAVRIVDFAFATDTIQLQRSAALLLFNNVVKLGGVNHQYEWPESLGSWPLQFDSEARAAIALALSEWLKNRPPTAASADFRMKLLLEARDRDPDPNVKSIATAATGP